MTFQEGSADLTRRCQQSQVSTFTANQSTETGLLRCTDFSVLFLYSHRSAKWGSNWISHSQPWNLALLSGAPLQSLGFALKHLGHLRLARNSWIRHHRSHESFIATSLLRTHQPGWNLTSYARLGLRNIYSCSIMYHTRKQKVQLLVQLFVFYFCISFHFSSWFLPSPPIKFSN